MKKILAGFATICVCVAGCTTTTRPANAANRETPERANRTTIADKDQESRYAAPSKGPGSLESR